MKRADRKKQLIAQGAIYRAEVLVAKQAVRASMRPQSPAKGTLAQIALAAFSLFASKGSPAHSEGALLRMLPLAAAALAALSKRKLLLKAALPAALMAGAAVLIAKKKRPARNAPGDAP